MFLEPMLDCMTHLREVYSEYFFDLADRRHVLGMTDSEVTNARFMPITGTMFRPRRMDIVPITLEDLTDVPLHYCVVSRPLHRYQDSRTT